MNNQGQKKKKFFKKEDKKPEKQKEKPSSLFSWLKGFRKKEEK